MNDDFIKNFPFPTLREKQSFVLKEIAAAIKDKLKDKAEDFVINEIFTIVRTTGYTYGVIIINEVVKNIHHAASVKP